MTTDQNTDTDLHDLILPTLPKWGPDVPGTPVEVTVPDGSVALSYAWRDGASSMASPDRKRRTGLLPWGPFRITAVLADDPTRWEPVDADERVELGAHLVGARVCGERDGVTVAGPVKEVDEVGWLWTEGWQLLAAPYDGLRVHPADLAKAREAAAPKPPTCWDEWEAGDVWAWGRVVYRMGDDRVLRRATRGGGMWVDAVRQPGGWWAAVPFTAPTEEHMALVVAADEAARLPDEPPLGSFVLDRNGGEWFRTVDGWVRARSGWNWEWAELNESHGPITVIHRAEP